MSLTLRTYPHPKLAKKPNWTFWRWVQISIAANNQDHSARPAAGVLSLLMLHDQASALCPPNVSKPVMIAGTLDNETGNYQAPGVG